MEILKFSSLYVYHLSNENVRGLVGKSCDLAEVVAASLSELPKSILTDLREKFNLFSSQVNREQKSSKTELVIAQRNICNSSHSEIKRVINFEIKSRVAEKKEAATFLKEFMQPYWNLSKQSLIDQQQSGKEMMQKYDANAAYAEAALTIGLKDIFIEFKTSNDELIDIYNSRNSEVSARTESSSDLRPACVEVYQHFCTTLELAVSYTQGQDLTNLFNQMDELRVKYRAMLPAEETITDEEADEIDPEM